MITNECTSTVVKDCYSQYAKYVNIGGRTVPLAFDTLKAVQKRVLLSAYELTKGHTFTKSARVVGHCIGMYHVHGDCLSGDTFIYCADGNHRTIQEVYESGVDSLDIIAYDEQNDKIVQTKAHSFRIGQQTNKVYRLHFHGRGTINCTENHPFLVNGKWTQAKDLKIGDGLKGMLGGGGEIDRTDLVFITDIGIKAFTSERPMYDFTVDGYHNMGIMPHIPYSKDLLHKVIFTHNSSVYDTMVSMVHQGMIQGRGNFGSNGIDPIPAAHMRYTECCLDPTINKIAFEYIDYVDKYKNDLDIDEPVYIPTMLPLNLIAFKRTSEPVIGIGVALKVSLPLFSLADSYKYMLSIIKDEEVNAEECLPFCYNEHRTPISKPIASTGKGKIDICGTYEIESDKAFKITSFPPFSNGLKIVENFTDNYIDESTDVINISIKVPRGKSYTEEDIRKGLTASYKVDMMFHDNEIIRFYNIRDIFETVYCNFKQAVERKLKSDLEKYEKEFALHSDMATIKPHLNPLNDKTAFRIKDELHDKGFFTEKVESLLRIPINKYCNIEKTLIEDQKNIKGVSTKIKNIDKHCLSLYQEIEPLCLREGK